jgi:hypothetical protein
MRKWLLNGGQECEDKFQIPKFKFQMKPKRQREKNIFETWTLELCLTSEL